MILKPGTRLQSQTCDTQVIVVKAPATDVDLRCGGQPVAVVGTAGDKLPIADAHKSGTLMGKRYGDDNLELLCTKPGEGSLSLGEEPIGPKDAKLLPSSD